jgi:hypothetical protein
MREQLRIGSVLCWTAAWLLAVAAPVLFLLEPTGATWWAWLLVLPVVALALWREDRKQMHSDVPPGLDGGPFSPPPGLQTGTTDDRRGPTSTPGRPPGAPPQTYLRRLRLLG